MIGKHTSYKRPAAALLLGAMMGSGAALMFAPSSGKDTRHRIQEFAGEARCRAQGYVALVKGKVKSAAREGRDFFEDKKSAITKAFDAGKEAYSRERERLSRKH